MNKEQNIGLYPEGEASVYGLDVATDIIPDKYKALHPIAYT